MIKINVLTFCNITAINQSNKNFGNDQFQIKIITISVVDYGGSYSDFI